MGVTRRTSHVARHTTQAGYRSVRNRPVTILAQFARLSRRARRSFSVRQPSAPTKSRIASSSFREPRAMSTCRRKFPFPSRLAPSARLRATLYAARLHCSAKANRSFGGNAAIAGRERITKRLASCQARRSRKSPTQPTLRRAVAGRRSISRQGARVHATSGV